MQSFQVSRIRNKMVCSRNSWSDWRNCHGELEDKQGRGVRIDDYSHPEDDLAIRLASVDAQMNR